MAGTDIDAVRGFNREIIRRLGVLDGDFLGRGRPYNESRLLFEIGRTGCDARQLRARLGLDSGYLSRLLSSLRRQGLVRCAPSRADARVTAATLTAKGLAELREIDRRSDAFAASLLEPLDESRRQRLLDAMGEVRRCLDAASVRIAPARPRGRAVRDCLQAYFAELAQRFDSGFDPHVDRGATATPEELTPPAGYFVLAQLDGQAVGCGALKVSGAVGEIKRMWVASFARGLGIGRRLLHSLEQIAREAGVERVQLDSHGALTEALALYRSAGYAEIAAFNENPYAQYWFEKALVRKSPAAHSD